MPERTARNARRRRRGPRIGDDLIRLYAQNLLRTKQYVRKRGRPARESAQKPLIPQVMAHFRLSRRRIESALRALPVPAKQTSAVPSTPQAVTDLTSPAASMDQVLREAAVTYLTRSTQRDPDVIVACKLIIDVIPKR